MADERPHYYEVAVFGIDGEIEFRIDYCLARMLPKSSYSANPSYPHGAYHIEMVMTAYEFNMFETFLVENEIKYEYTTTKKETVDA